MLKILKRVGKIKNYIFMATYLIRMTNQCSPFYGVELTVVSQPYGSDRPHPDKVKEALLRMGYDVSNPGYITCFDVVKRIN